jgi:hypothetical protein
MSFVGKTCTLQGQLMFENPSFESVRSHCLGPESWNAFGNGCTPDLQPGQWRVNLKPSSGTRCLGLVSREDGTSEAIIQKLNETIPPASCTQFTMDIAFSSNYAMHPNAAKLKIWGSADGKQKSELMYSGPVPEKDKWKTIEVKMYNEKIHVKFLIFEASNVNDSKRNNGNILIDNLSKISRCPRA